MLSKGTSKTGQQDNCNPNNQTTITIQILVDELKNWKCDVCNRILTMGDGNIDLHGTQQRTAAVVYCSSCSQKAPPKLANKTTVTPQTRQQSLF
jgi:hypothetical protein